jgi:hypothetical protein
MAAPQAQEPPMSHTQRILIAGLLCAGSSGCQPADVPASAAADTASTPVVAEAPAPAQPQPEPVAPPAANAGEIAYRCGGDAVLSASYGNSNVTLRWPDGRRVMLPRAESASKGGGDVYVGDTVSLQRDGGRIELHDGDAPAVTCTESAS